LPKDFTDPAAEGGCSVLRGLTKEKSMRSLRQPWLRDRRSGRGRRFFPSFEVLESRLVPYSVSGDMWPHGNLVTISFMPDGTDLGGVQSILFAQFNSHPGWTTSTWQTQILKAAQAWAQQTNLNFAIVPDNGAPEGSGNYQQGDPGMGDIRIGGYNIGTSVLAQAFMPPQDNNYSIAGDMQFNTGQPFNIGSTYDLYTVALHEFGHALGLYGSSTISAAMYETYSGVKFGLTSDDAAGIRSIYSNGNARAGDTYDGNGSFATAANLTAQINLLTSAALIPDLDLTSINGSNGARTYAENDYFTFTAPLLTTNTLTVQVQSTGLSLLSPTVTVYAANQTTVLASASGAGQYGATISATVTGVTPLEQFYVKVSGATTNTLGSGKYALGLNFGTGSMPTEAPPNTQTANGSPLTSGGGQPNAQSNEYRVNTTTAGVQQTFAESPQAVAMAANGNYVVTWGSYGQDGSGWGVYAQRYDANGVPLGNEFQVNTTTQDDQKNPTVAMDSTGDFVVTWSSNNQDGSGWGVYAQRYRADGTPQGGEFQVNTTTAGDQMYSSVAMDSTGDFVITWSSNRRDGSGWGVYGQCYSSTGAAVGSEFQVNSTTAGDQMYSSVAMDAVGDFVITWGSYGPDGSGLGVYARHYGSIFQALASVSPTTSSPTTGVTGTSNLVTGDSGPSIVALGGSQFQVNTTTGGNLTLPVVAMDSVGDFIITWSSYGEDGSGWGVFAQRYNAAGVPQGTEFQVNTHRSGDQEYSRVAMDPSGNSIITWSSNGQDHSGWGVYAQQYDALGLPLGSEFQVNTTTAGDQMYSSVALDGLGHAVIVWSGNGPGDTDGVFGQRYNLTGTDLNMGIRDALEIADDSQTAATPPSAAADASVVSAPTDQVAHDVSRISANSGLVPANTPAFTQAGAAAPSVVRAAIPATPVPEPTVAVSPTGRLQISAAHAWEGAKGGFLAMMESGQDASNTENTQPAISSGYSEEPSSRAETITDIDFMGGQWQKASSSYFTNLAGTVTCSDARVELHSEEGETPASVDLVKASAALGALLGGFWGFADVESRKDQFEGRVGWGRTDQDDWQAR
jgi:hypothetical protein